MARRHVHTPLPDGTLLGCTLRRRVDGSLQERPRLKLLKCYKSHEDCLQELVAEILAILLHPLGRK